MDGIIFRNNYFVEACMNFEFEALLTDDKLHTLFQKPTSSRPSLQKVVVEFAT
jgi:hypothetical protein